MGTRVHVMDLEVDLFTKETLLEELNAYLDSDILNVVHLISLDYVDMYDKNELVQQVLEDADMVLPGEKAILSAHHVDVLETGGMAVDYHALMDIWEYLQLEDKTFYLVVRDEKEAKAFYRYLARHFEKAHVLGVHAANGDVTEESLINDINTKLPDVVILSMDSTAQEEWIEKNKNRLNTKLCLVMGSVTPLVLKENVHVPGWIRKIHLEKKYRKIAKFPYSHSVRKRIFNRKMDDYITKKKQQE